MEWHDSKAGVAALLGLALAAMPALVQAAQPASTSACDGPQFRTVLQPAPTIEVRAYWLDRQWIQWPQQPSQPAARYRLYHSAAGTLQAPAGAAVTGADGALDLSTVDGALPESLATRFKFIADGPRLRLAEADLARLPQLFKSQLLLVQETAGGTVLAATALQMAGALDDVYAAAAELGDLGVQPTRQGTGFQLWAPTAQQVALCRFASGSGAALAEEAMQFDATTGLWRTRLPADLSGQYYSYLVDVFVPMYSALI
eukprot:Opistho-1_new@90875